MILAVCLNPALDLTYEVPALAPGTSHRVQRVHERPGGKACNTARVLGRLSVEVTLCGFAGGARGARFRSALAATAVKDRLTVIDGETRQSVAVVDRSGVTVLNEPGPSVVQRDWDALLADVDSALDGARVAVLSGSVPPGAPDDAWAQLVRHCRRRGVPSVLDTAGSQLLAALDEQPAVAAPNHHEAGEALGTTLEEPDEILAAAVELSARSRGAVVVSAGSDGLVAARGERRWRVRPPRVVEGNPTGAGDALAAALAWGLAEERELPDILADAVCLAGSAVVPPTAGEIDLATYRELRHTCEVEELR